VFNFGLRTVPAMIQELLVKSNMTMDNIDHVVFHQTNQFMNDTIRKKAQIPESKFVTHIDPCGNTVSASIPIALYEGMAAGRIRTSDTVMLVAFGSGLSWAATIINI
jgi:3-oxoacyl-[acyl-carrier-protein] synthase III